METAEASLVEGETKTAHRATAPGMAGAGWCWPRPLIQAADPWPQTASGLEPYQANSLLEPVLATYPRSPRPASDQALSDPPRDPQVSLDAPA